MNRIVLLVCLLSTCIPAWSGEGVTLSDLADRAELIAIVRVEETEYTKTRGFPSRGRAILKVLIPYRGTQRDAYLEVTEEGLEDTACYYPEVDPFAFEGPRFLVFLNKHPDKDVYRGRRPGCLIPILVTRDSQYAMRHPVPGLDVPIEAIRPLDYSDPAALIDISDLTFAEADRLEQQGIARPVQTDDPLAPDQGLMVYSRGVPIAALRTLMFDKPTQK